MNTLWLIVIISYVWTIFGCVIFRIMSNSRGRNFSRKSFGAVFLLMTEISSYYGEFRLKNVITFKNQNIWHFRYFWCTFNSYVFACAFPRFLPSTMLHLAVCPFAKLCPKREAVLGQYCIFIRRSSRHPARPIPKQLTFGRFKNIIFRFRILEK